MFRSVELLKNVLFVWSPSLRSVSTGNCCHLKRNVRFFSRINGVKLNAAVRNNPVIMKLETPEFKAVLTDEVKKLSDMFTRHGFELRVAGGAVRDLLLGIQPKDLDFATTATPEEMKEMFTKLEIRMLNKKGEKHGTITVRIDDKANFEITTLRIDVATDGRHAEVEFTQNWMLDANRRDLTINSMFLGLDGTVYDYFHGYEDLQKRRVVFVGDANKRIKEDYLRILRYFRFYGRISKNPDNHEENVLTALRDNAEGLKQISGERIWSELSLILTGNFAGELFRLLIDLSIGPHIGLPEKCNVDELKKIWEELQSNRFKVHAITLACSVLNSVEEFEGFKVRNKLSSFDRDLGYFLISNREKQENSIRPYQVLLLKHDGKKEHKVKFITELLKYKGDVDLLREFEKWEVPQFPISGHIIKQKGVAKPVAVGIVKNKLLDIWIESDFKMSREELENAIPEILETTDLSVPKKRRDSN